MSDWNFFQKVIVLVAFATSLAASPCTAQSGTTVILVPGAGGATPNDFLIRNTSAFTSAGLQTTVAMSPAAISAAARAVRATGGKPVVVAMSKGTQAAAQAIAQGAPVAGAVFVSGFMAPGAPQSVPGFLGSAGRLPPTLVVHHRRDECPMTTPAGAAAFASWSGGRASVHWVDGGRGGGAPCRPFSAHGFVGQDGQATSAIIAFARSR